MKKQRGMAAHSGVLPARGAALRLLFVAALLLHPAAVRADPLAPSAGETPLPTQNAITSTGPGLWDRPNLFGDPWDSHRWLADNGISATLTLATEVLRNTSGGYELSTHLQAEAVLTLGLDLDKAFGWQGGRAYSSFLAIGGGGVSIDGVGSLATISSIEAERSFRLFELWFEQRFLHDRVSVRVGQLAVDQEFMLTSTGSVFLNADFGWPTLASIDLPAGGPAYPLATPGVRAKVEISPATTLLAAIYNGNPAPDGFADPQQTNTTGTNFRLNGGVFAIAELQRGVDFGGGNISLPGSYKVGAWWNSNSFLDQHHDSQGLSLANFNSSGFPALRRNNWSLYADADQVLWRRPGHTDDGLSAFVRVMGAPDDRNQLSFEVDGGFAWRGFLASRPNDTVGLGFGWFKISEAARGLDRDIAALGLRRPIRSAEGMIEATYQAEVAPWWQIQPDFQYIIRPGGGVPGGDGPDSLTRPLGNAFIAALRMTISF